jgi:BirA family transcriptional regulator, biotin operon repressor / biotin---[acetyl-CoA-carboxylase] ligase
MIGKKIKKFDSLDSTNDYLKSNIDNFLDGDVILAYSQTSGRGRFNNTWNSPKGSLYFSYVIKGKIKRTELFQYLMLSSLAVVSTLSKYGLSAKIKYPNDILVNKRKIAGILIESIGYEDIDSIIIGVGINLNQERFPNTLSKATSIYKETNKKLIVDETLNEYILSYNNLEKLDNVYKHYLEKSLIIGKSLVYFEQEYKVVNVLPSGKIQISNGLDVMEVSYEEINLEEIY